MEAIVDAANMQRAWDQVRGNRGAPGPDGITLTQFPEWLRPQWAAIRQQLLDGFVFRGVTGMIHVSEKNVQKCKRRIRELTGRSRGISMTQRLGELCRYLRAGRGFGLAKQMRLFDTSTSGSASSADAPLETLAVRPYAGSESRGARRSTPTGLPRRKESQGPWHMAKTIAQRGRDDERLAARSGTGVADITRSSGAAPSNREVRTRMLRGVGWGGAICPPTDSPGGPSDP